MLGRQQQSYVALPKLATVRHLSPTLYEYRSHAGWGWLQRLCFWVLDKIGAHHEEYVNTWTRTKRENDDLISSLFGQEGWIIEYLHHRGPLRVFMGPDNHKELMDWCYKNGMQHFSMTGSIETKDGRYGKWHDIPITVVPWMMGAVIVPTETER